MPAGHTGFQVRISDCCSVSGTRRGFLSLPPATFVQLFQSGSILGRSTSVTQEVAGSFTGDQTLRGSFTTRTHTASLEIPSHPSSRWCFHPFFATEKITEGWPCVQDLENSGIARSNLGSGRLDNQGGPVQKEYVEPLFKSYQEFQDGDSRAFNQGQGPSEHLHRSHVHAAGVPLIPAPNLSKPWGMSRELSVFA